MNYLARMIEISNWCDEEGSLILPENVNSIKADGITKDLKSDNNTISLWEINSLDELKEIAISLLTSKSKPQDLFVVAIPKNTIEEYLEIENNNAAETAFKKFKNRHYDLLNMTLEKLKILASIILSALQNENNIYDFTFINRKDAIKELINNGDIIFDELKGALKKEFN